MKNQDRWKPTKYVYRGNKLVASKDHNEVKIGSRLVSNRIAHFYDINIPLYAKGKLLDLGCGKVPLFIAYNKHITENICVDWGNSVHKNEHLDFECNLIEPLPFEDAEFDTIILSDVLEHIPQPEFLWEEMARLLSDDGTILMNVPFYYWLHEHPHDYYRYTEFALQRFVDDAGLELVQLEAIGGSLDILADIVGKHLQMIPFIGKLLSALIQSVTELFDRTALGKKVIKETCQYFPLGYFVVARKRKQS